jgi:UDP-glucose 4-epimerase
VDRLVEEGHEVSVYDNLSSGRLEFLGKGLAGKRISFVEGDLLDLPKLVAEVSGHDFVYHMAANPDIRYGIEHTRWDLDQNTVATYNVLEAMRRNDVKKIVFPSTSTVYGEPSTIPTPEDYGPLLPISLYGASKLACEALVSAYCGTFGFRAWIFRFANVVGPRGTHGVVYDFIEKLGRNPTELEILGDGRQTKSYLLVDEVVDAVFYAVEHAKDAVNVFNLGCGDQVSVREIAEVVAGEMGLRGVPFRFTGGSRGWPGDVTEMNLATGKINDLGWRAKHSSKEAVRLGVRGMLSCRR